MSTRPRQLLRQALGVLFGIALGTAVNAATSPSTSVDPYLVSHLPGVEVTSILTVDDGSVPKAGGGTTRLVGIPDGVAVFDGAELNPADPDFFYLLVNHELNATQGVVRDHGSAGAFVSKWKIDKTTLEVVEGDDLIKQTFSWDEGSQSFFADTLLFDRMCSSDRPDGSALFNSASGLGTQEIIYLNGEESNDGRAFGHVVTGPDAGNSYHLEHMGYSAWENVLASPFEQDATVVILTDDSSNGEVYVYVGTKRDSGNDVEKAGLVGGSLYAIAVPGKPFELDRVIADGVGAVEAVELKLIGSPGNRPMNENDTEARGADTLTPLDPSQTFASLKMGGPEDGAWDTRSGFENVFYFASKGTSSNGENAPTRLWSLVFDDITDPAAGATLNLLLNGPDNRLGSLDNMDFAIIDGVATLLLQEDLGGDARLSRIWAYDVDSGQLEEILEHDPQRFSQAGNAFFTTNEESSGVLDLQHVLGDGWFASSIQVHTSSGLSNTAELVEQGQLLLFNVNGRGADLQRENIVETGASWDFRVDGVDPGPNWNQTGFAPDADWNRSTDGAFLGASPSPLGYGEPAGNFATDLVQPASPRAASYYFREEFNLANPAEVIGFDVYLKTDDGAVVYINGVEVARYNMSLTDPVDNGTFANRNEPAERDWKYIPLTGVNVPLQAAGNVIAVSVHQENDSSSDMRLDLQLIALNESPDAGTAPAVPANLMVGNPTFTSLDVSWDAQSDAKFFRLERQVDGDDAWEVIAAEVPGVFNTFTDAQAESGVTYNYRLWAVNIHGRSALSATASGTTQISLTPVIFEEDFDVPDSFGKFTAVDVAGADRNFSWVLWDFGSTGAVQGNGFGGSGPTVDWLITTNPLNFPFFRNETLEYDSQISFSGPAPLVQYSTDYDPAVHASPEDATWVLINEDTTSNGSLTPVGPFDISAIPDTAYIAFRYESLGGGGGQSTRATFDDVIIKGNCGFDFEGAENGDIADDATSPWTVVNLDSDLGWIYDTRAGQQSAINNNFGSEAGGVNGGSAANDYLISPPIFVDGPTAVEFQYYENFGDTLDQPLAVLVTDNYTGDPTTTVWTDITPVGLDGSTSDAYIPVQSEVFDLSGANVRVAFHYRSAGNSGGTTKRIGVDNICIAEQGGALEGSFAFSRSGGEVSFVPNISGGVAPFEFAWDFGDGNSSTEQAPVHTYTETGLFTVSLTVTDSNGASLTATRDNVIEVTEFAVPQKARLRVAAYNASMNRANAGELAADLAAGDDGQIQAVAEVIQRARPEILLLNEFDQIYDANGEFDRAATEQSIRDFIANYLEVAQADDVDPISYRFFYVSPSNTGVPAGLDFNNDGQIGGGNDAFGFGNFPGQFAMIVLSQHRLLNNHARTFQKFLWKDMPGALLPPDPNDTDDDGSTDSYYNAEELDAFRLSSKTHIDLPVLVRGFGVVHLLASHPTPPVFDDGTATTYPSTEVADWNGLRNHDEIRFWGDYVNRRNSRYIYDDAEFERAGNTTPRRKRGGLRGTARFIILGDQNADPLDGDATFNPAQAHLLTNPAIDVSLTPNSAGAFEQVPGSFNNRDEKTSSFNLRADYALPSQRGFKFNNAWVFWPRLTDKEASVLDASDHRMVVIDLDRDSLAR